LRIAFERVTFGGLADALPTILGFGSAVSFHHRSETVRHGQPQRHGPMPLAGRSRGPPRHFRRRPEEAGQV